MKPASASADASCPKTGTPATDSSRSIGSEPPTSTIAGKRNAGLGFDAGCESVPIRPKP